jgi:hypothetical protein
MKEHQIYILIIIVQAASYNLIKSLFGNICDHARNAWILAMVMCLCNIMHNPHDPARGLSPCRNELVSAEKLWVGFVQAQDFTEEIISTSRAEF